MTFGQDDPGRAKRRAARVAELRGRSDLLALYKASHLRWHQMVARAKSSFRMVEAMRPDDPRSPSTKARMLMDDVERANKASAEAYEERLAIHDAMSLDERIAANEWEVTLPLAVR